MNDIKKIVWAYLIENGQLTSGEWSYYGSRWEYPEDCMGYGGWKTLDKAHNKFLKAVKSIGVDWEKTAEPETRTESSFTGTFSDAENIDAMIGTLVLKDGSEYKVGTNNSNVNFYAAVKMLVDIMESNDRVKTIFGEA